MQIRALKSSKRLSIKQLKDFALKLPKGSVLRGVLLLEKDELEVNEFLIKMDVWLKLLKMEFS
ncbi:hypothetical protein KEJ50_07315 [Candidatus Bathyarchaeota archaeon]|nr:hypothetical protein [Candidatus Bathyarchaeota archaeon]